MKDQAAYYSLVQFCPDQSRLEGVNIGVVLYLPNEKRVLVEMTRSHSRIRRLFGNQDWRLFHRAKSSVQNQLTHQQFLTLEELEAYISKRANAVQLTSPRPIRVITPQTSIRELYNRLVEDNQAEHKERIDVCLTRKFTEAGVLNLVKKPVAIEIPEIKATIRVPYGYQNGRFNLIEPVQFDTNPDIIIAKASKNAIEGQLLYSRRDPTLGNMRLVVVANFDREIENSTREFVKRTLANHDVKLYSFDDLNPLVDDIRLSAAAHS